MKLTRNNGRTGKNGAYNPKHNDRRKGTVYCLFDHSKFI